MNKTAIDIYYSSSVLSFVPKIAQYQAVLTTEELAIAERFKYPELKQRYIINHGILRQLLAQYVDELAADIAIEKAQYGKPFLAAHPELSFNMSHTGNILAIAISSQCQLGIDVEHYKTRNTWSGMVKKCFAAEEADYWHSLNATQQARAFYQFWVKKEAFVKAVGQGITLGLDQCVVNPDDFTSFLRLPTHAGLVEHWQIYTLDLAENTFSAVVCDKKNALLRLIEL